MADNHTAVDRFSTESVGRSGSTVSPDRLANSYQKILNDQLTRDLERMYRDPETADVVFSAGPRNHVKLHSFVLISRTGKYWSQRKELMLSVLQSHPSPVVIPLKCSLQCLKCVVQYLYTGEIEFQNVDVLEMLEVCQQLVMPTLQSYCLDNLSRSLDAKSACSLLKRHQEAGPGTPTSLSVIDVCMKYVERRTKEVFMTEAFLDLPKNTLLNIVKNDKLCLPEEDLWRSVLRWGCHKTRCPGDSKKWREGDKEKMKQALDGIIDHIRLMQIDSSVFAQEVEPTGLLTVEQTLARYRMAALPNMSSQGTGEQGPRGTTEFFADSEILTYKPKHQRKLNEWFGVEDQDWVLLFRGSRDGFHSMDFHHHCDEQGPTLVLVKEVNGNVFGGYTDVSWTSNARKGRYASSKNAFLFSLINSEQKSVRMDVRQPSYAIQGHPKSGPIFGAGADLFISSECNMNKDSYSNLPHSYGDQTHPQHLLAGSYSFQVEDYEVFKPSSTGPYTTAI